MWMREKLAFDGQVRFPAVPAANFGRTHAPVASPAQRLQRQVRTAMAAPWAGLSVHPSSNHLPGMVKITVPIMGGVLSWWFVLGMLRVVI